ncbi:hypothetical protein BZA77DRAFT_277731 [Pyronema omphalodes]|nr:hypothetical protein BZA77DRAFT_277731 [Pyronema omphalodes]
MNAIWSNILWFFLPQTVTGWVVSFYFRVMTRAGDPQPTPGTPLHNRVTKRVYITLISAYLLYTIYESYYDILQKPTFYDLLQVPHDVTAKDLKSQFRRLTIQFHPDKAGAGTGDFFVLLKIAYDTLLDPTKRFAYERFGPEVVGWERCSSLYDYISHGFQTVLPYYAGTLMVLTVLSVLGKFEFGRWWRFWGVGILAIFEAALLTRPHALIPAMPYWKTLLPFEQIVLARKLVVTCFIALNQLGPYLEQKTMSKDPMEDIAKLAVAVEQEAVKIQKMVFLPFEGDNQARRELERNMGERLVEITVGTDPEVKMALGGAFKRRNEPGVVVEEAQSP